jgi:hypothetical protein
VLLIFLYIDIVVLLSSENTDFKKSTSYNLLAFSFNIINPTPPGVPGPLFLNLQMKKEKKRVNGLKDAYNKYRFTRAAQSFFNRSKDMPSSGK